MASTASQDHIPLKERSVGAEQSARRREPPTGQIEPDVAYGKWTRHAQTLAPSMDRSGQGEEDGEVVGTY
ncbi:MAG: hypothetical protein ACLQGV_13660 [Bryobacteraceae bacterium]